MYSRVYHSISDINRYVFRANNDPKIAGSLALTTVGIGLNILSTYSFGIAVASFTSGTPISFLGSSIPTLGVVGIYGGSWMLVNMITTLRTQLLTSVGPEATKDLVIDYLSNLMNQSLGYHNTAKLGDHVNRVCKCYMAMANVSTQVFSNIVPTSLEILVAIGLLSYFYNAEMVLALIGLIAVSTIYNLSTVNKIRSLREEMLKRGIKVFDDFTETLGQYETVHAFNNLPFTMDKLKQTIVANAQGETRANEIIPKIGSGQNLISGIGFCLISLLAARNVETGDLSVQNFVTLCAYASSLLQPLNQFWSAVINGFASAAELDLVYNDLKLHPQIIDHFPDRRLEVTRENASIAFENVSFRYSDDSPQILDNVSFTVAAGQKVGIVGTTGCGKTTIGNILFRFYEPTSGRVLINGQNINEVGLYSLRSAIGIVAQNPVLFNDTLYNNIAFGGLSRASGVIKEDVETVAKAACLHSYIESQPKGYQTEVGERGTKISGGQRQRLAIARTMLKNPSIYIFDEATSALDAKVQNDIQKNIDDVSVGVTSVVITHQLANLVNADKIIVLDKGKVVEEGRHEELLRIENGVYAGLWRQQHKAHAIDIFDDPDNDVERPPATRNRRGSIFDNLPSLPLTTATLFARPRADSMQSVRSTDEVELASAPAPAPGLRRGSRD